MFNYCTADDFKAWLELVESYDFRSTVPGNGAVFNLAEELGGEFTSQLQASLASSAASSSAYGSALSLSLPSPDAQGGRTLSAYNTLTPPSANSARQEGGGAVAAEAHNLHAITVSVLADVP